MFLDIGDGGEGCEWKEGDMEMDQVLGFYFIIFVSFFVCIFCYCFLCLRILLWGFVLIQFLIVIVFDLDNESFFFNDLKIICFSVIID